MNLSNCVSLRKENPFDNLLGTLSFEGSRVVTFVSIGENVIIRHNNLLFINFKLVSST